MTIQAVPDRIDSKIMKVIDGCWLWTAATNGNGYGVVLWRGKQRYAHRVLYEVHHGEVPTGLEIDHLCRVSLCVNPGHMEAVTHRENNNRGTSPSAVNARKTHCDYGHLLDGDNLYTAGQSARVCKACQKRRQIEYKARRARCE